ncbi:hypothetical protein GUITHDRAFT_138357 [Guillardia theta CCMP2712]|uniref:Transcription factor IIIC subunit 5 HTH domain-containing protein n=1 Tax=Guillardia theta (strain CCMP2712) TaxID=905079 RepID=L1JCJ3_GUITC|nr:hypothetical protein GUITHDRAFT_138357 [Guillardia theta CCMP2712]EKX46251.1 hypothetical protein GUITHDRAFT_138357 [Guillardia theta CCMP2712]|eukprot:XP_005833231.1 hypothetical protein GUITHDRAFT_138357 [Guillardia theta CCMP2712]
MVEGEQGRRRKAVVVEMPGRVREEGRALEALGGTSSLSSVFSRPRALLPLLLRSRDSHAHPIFGDPEQRTLLLLRVRRPNGDGQCEAQVLGHAERIYNFRGMADFQFVDPATAAKARGGGGPAPTDVYSLLEGQTGGETLQLVPPIFSKVDQPQAYGFRQNMAFKHRDPEDQAPAEGSRPGRRRKPSKDVQTLKKQSIQWRHPPPSAPHAQAVEVTMGWEGREASMGVLRRLFEQRPIWSRLALQGTILEEAEKHLRFLPLVAFNYKDGPWRSLWVRYGFDPRSDKSTRFLQSYDFRVPSKFLSLFKPTEIRQQGGKAGGPQPFRLKGMKGDSETSSSTASPADVFRFREVPPQAQMMYQLLDIDDAQIQRFLQLAELFHKRFRVLVGSSQLPLEGKKALPPPSEDTPTASQASEPEAQIAASFVRQLPLPAESSSASGPAELIRSSLTEAARATERIEGDEQEMYAILGEDSEVSGLPVSEAYHRDGRMAIARRVPRDPQEVKRMGRARTR